MLIDRSFFRLREGLVHVRSLGGNGTAMPLLMLHASPSSSRCMEPLMRALVESGHRGQLIAADTLGNGDSAPPALESPEIDYFADSVERLIEVVGLEQVDVYGTHTGARIAAELAVRFPERVRRVVLDGIADYPPQIKQQILANYAPRIAPDEYGRQLIWAFNFTRDQALYFPYFMRDTEHRIEARMPSPQELQLRAIDVLKALETYHKPYLAAFRYPAGERLPQIAAPTLLLSSQTDAPLLRTSARNLATLIPRARLVELSGEVGAKAVAVADFLGSREAT
jgi:pimeloyl-ACP methyl ester carboxylesterase